MEPTEVELRDFLAKADRLFHARADVVAGTRRRKAPGFNIFSLTTWSDIEVRTHQKFLAYLLDPTQAHEQGNLFLEPFLKLISDRTGIPLPTPNTIWSVTQGTHDIDVLLRHQDSGQSVVVEVKWMASEHRREQLYSYWRRERDRTKKLVCQRSISPDLASNLAFRPLIHPTSSWISSASPTRTISPVFLKNHCGRSFRAEFAK
jgi:hypothetical protein